MINENDRILVGLSGGPDSIFLLYILHNYFNNQLIIAHINHKLRGIDSDLDEKFIRTISQKLKIPLYVIREDVKKLSTKNKKSIEEVGRDVRFSFFNKILKVENFNKIALGHNLDDNVETILINFIKGSGMKGLIGIPEKRDNIIHPIINIKKEEILKYLEENKIEYRIDKTNFETDYLRNKVRNYLLPIIEKEFNKNFKEKILALSNILKVEDKFLDDLVENIKNDILKFEDDFVKIDLKKLQNLHLSLKRRLIRKVIDHFNKDLREYPLDHIDKVISLENKKTGKEIELPLNLIAVKDKNNIIIERRDFEIPDFYIEIPDIGSYQEIGMKIELSLVEKISKVKDPFISFFDYDKIELPLKIRKPMFGEKFKPLGLKKEKKIQDFFVDSGIPKSVRWNLPILLDKKDDILWIVGVRISDDYKVTNLTNRVICIKITLEDFRWIKIFKRFL
ncbi:MAG TPA: tRNA lysidine(34) synthetase TilS [Caldisericia bacterium]|nr:tRNA lysidine(34) synthetase TilS [Caldisericia bacterium]HPP43572.1 tRNA lysidine(34) synthetase TilS [Caldisericia bacterium]HRT37241.1 tRNA lysidine(34) synthetase TilS [Caldisericia bacterium]